MSEYIPSDEPVTKRGPGRPPKVTSMRTSQPLPFMNIPIGYNDGQSIRLQALELAIKSMGVQINNGADEIILRRAAAFAMYIAGKAGQPV